MVQQLWIRVVPDTELAGYPANETGYPAGYRIKKGWISGATLLWMYYYKTLPVKLYECG